MKGFYILITLLTFLPISLSNCSKEDENAINLMINGKLETWTLGDGKILKLCHNSDTSVMPSPPYSSFGSSSIDNSGNFNISSLTTPSSSLLAPLDSIFGINITISNNTAKALKCILFVFNNASSYPIGDVVKGYNVSVSSPDSFTIKYIYVDQEVIITGTGTLTKKSGLTTIVQNNNCNLTLKAGWNKYVQKIIAVNGYSTTNEIHTNEIEGAKWYFESYN